jgi:hypothetical protein
LYSPALNLYFDSKIKKYYIYCSRGIVVVDMKEEGKDVWKFYVEKGMLKEAYENSKKQNTPF